LKITKHAIHLICIVLFENNQTYNNLGLYGGFLPIEHDNYTGDSSIEGKDSFVTMISTRISCVNEITMSSNSKQ
jgi:hypothetical protein